MHAGTTAGTGRHTLRALAAVLAWSACAFPLAARAQDTTPDAYDFADQFAAAQATVVSNIVTISGIDAPAALSLTGEASARFRVNGGPLQSGTANVSNGDRLQLRLVSGRRGSRAATVTIGGVADTWTVTTADPSPRPFAFIDQTVGGAQSVSSNSVSVRGINVPATLTLTGAPSARFRINGGPPQSGTATVNSGDRVRLRLASSATAGARSATLDIGGVSDTWTVTTASTSGCGTPFDPAAFGDEDGDGKPETAFAFTVAGVERAAAIRFPSPYDNDVPHPLVFEFHGDQEDTADGLVNSGAFGSGVIGANEYGEQAIVIALRGENILAPEVRDNLSEFISWNTLSPPAENNDIQAVLAIRDTVAAAACVDPDRVFAGGFSRGGFFANTLRCHGIELRATAQFQSGLEGHPPPDRPGFGDLVDDDGNLLALDLASCVTRAAPKLVVHGLLDGAVRLETGHFAAQFWAGMNGCDTDIADAVASPLDAQCVEFAGCGANPVALCRPDDVGHEVWSPEGANVIESFFGRFFD